MSDFKKYAPIRKIVSVLVAMALIISFMPAHAQNESITLIANVPTDYTIQIPNESGNFTFTYTSSNPTSATAVLTIQTENQTLSRNLTVPADGTTRKISLEKPEPKGTQTFTFTSTEDMTISNIQFYYKDTVGLAKNIAFTDLSDNEEAIHTAVLINRDASCIIVNGAKRYIDFNNANAKPVISEGRICLPARVLALSLGYYFENNTDKNYILLRNAETGVGYYFTAEESYRQLYNGVKEPVDFVPFYKDGEAYLPIRYFGEALGKTVEYKDGIAVIDEKQYAEKIVNDTTVFEYVKGLFADYTVAPQTGKTYHVAKNGDDKNDGKTKETAFETLEKAGQEAEAGDTVIIHEGTYREVLSPENDGTATSPIIFKAAGDGEVIISALEEVSGFTAYDSELITAPLPEDLGLGRNQMFMNGECLVEARYPNSPGIAASEYGGELSKLFPVLGDFEVSGKKADGTDVTTAKEATVVTSETLLNDGTDWSGGAFVSAHGNGYSLCIAKIESSEVGKLHLCNLPTKWWWNPRYANWIDFGYITGHKNAIDLPGEWVIENGQIVMKAPEGKTAENLTVEMKQRQLVIDIADRSYIKISGIKTIGGGVKMNDSISCILDGMDMRYIGHYTYSDDQRHGFINNFSDYNKPALSANTAPERGEVGVYVGGSDNAIINSVIDHSAAAGIYMTGVYAYIDNNTISNCGYMGSYVSGITVMNRPTQSFGDKRGGFALYNNKIKNAGRSLINIQGLEGYPRSEGADAGVSYIAYLPFDIAYNELCDGTLFSVDTGAFYHYSDNCATERARSKLRNNYIYYTRSEKLLDSAAIYNDGYSNGVDCFNNVVFGTQAGGGYTDGYFRNVGLSTCGLYRNNMVYSAVPNGPLGLTAEQFPFGQPFYAGRLDDSGAYMRNYNREDEGVKYVPVTEATLTNTSLNSDGNVLIDSKDDKITFSNINLGENTYNKITLLFGGADIYVTRADAVLNFKFTGTDESEQFEFLMDTHSYNEEDINSMFVDMLPKGGSFDLEISVPQFVNSFWIRGLIFSSDGADVTGNHDGTRIVAGDFDAMYTLPHYGETYSERKVYRGAEGTTVDATTGLTNGEIGLKEYYGEKYIKNCIEGTTLLYRNVKIDETVKYLNIQMSVSQQQANRKVTITIDSPDSGLFGANTVFSGNFAYNGKGNYETQTYKLNGMKALRGLSAGTYDVYITFSEGYTSDLLSFGFAAEQ